MGTTRWWSRASLLCASTIAALLLLELPTLFGYDYRRRLAAGRAETWLQLATGVQRPDRELLFVHKSHGKYQGSVVGNLAATLGLQNPTRYQVDVAYDQNGFRNNDDLVTADVVVIGDSFVEGAETPQSETMVSQLGRRLGVVAANLGQSNYGPQQELVVLSRYGLRLKPKAVVWVFFGGNDLENVTEYEELRSQGPEPASIVDRLFTRNVLDALSRLTAARPAAAADASARAFTFTRADGTVETLYLDRADRPWTTHQWDVASDSLDQAHNLSRDGGAGFLLVYVPRKLSVYRGFLKAPADSFANSWPQGHLPDLLREWCGERKIDYLDATIPLREAVQSGVSVYLPDDVHWNAAGHAVVAAAVAEQIRSLIR